MGLQALPWKRRKRSLRSSQRPKPWGQANILSRGLQLRDEDLPLPLAASRSKGSAGTMSTALDRSAGWLI